MLGVTWIDRVRVPYLKARVEEHTVVSAAFTLDKAAFLGEKTNGAVALDFFRTASFFALNA